MEVTCFSVQLCRRYLGDFGTKFYLFMQKILYLLQIEIWRITLCTVIQPTSGCLCDEWRQTSSASGMNRALLQLPLLILILFQL